MFLVEGAKSVLEVLASGHHVKYLLLTQNFYKCCIDDIRSERTEVIIVSEDELRQAGTFENNNTALAVVEMPENLPIYPEKHEYVLILDEIKDPGNLGTILRVADWYGINKVICSMDTTELYNPKVINSSMGSFTRVAVYYTDLVVYLTKLLPMKVYGAFLDGADLHQTNFAEEGGAIVMGNESNGISDKIQHLISDKITIPRYGAAESLNVGIATAVILDNLRRDVAR